MAGNYNSYYDGLQMKVCYTKHELCVQKKNTAHLRGVEGCNIEYIRKANAYWEVVGERLLGVVAACAGGRVKPWAFGVLEMRPRDNL